MRRSAALRLPADAHSVGRARAFAQESRNGTNMAVEAPKRPSPLKPIHVLFICLGVVLMLFAGSIIIGVVAWQANKDSGQTVQTDLPAQQ